MNHVFKVKWGQSPSYNLWSNILFWQLSCTPMELDLGKLGFFSISKAKSFGRKSCGYNGRTVWNELPIDIRNMQRYPDFKLAIRFFIGKIDL